MGDSRIDLLGSFFTVKQGDGVHELSAPVLQVAEGLSEKSYSDGLRWSELLCLVRQLRMCFKLIKTVHSFRAELRDRLIRARST